jgi:hypothetical protein
LPRQRCAHLRHGLHQFACHEITLHKAGAQPGVHMGCSTLLVPVHMRWEGLWTLPVSVLRRTLRYGFNSPLPYFRFWVCHLTVSPFLATGLLRFCLPGSFAQFLFSWKPIPIVGVFRCNWGRVEQVISFRSSLSLLILTLCQHQHGPGDSAGQNQ